MDEIQREFHGKLVEKLSENSFALTSLGEQLAKFFETAKEHGLDWNATIQALGGLDVFEVATLFVAREGLQRFQTEG